LITIDDGHHRHHNNSYKMNVDIEDLAAENQSINQL
jgi:hypothetical protein